MTTQSRQKADSVNRLTGGLLILIPVVFNIGYGLLAQRFDYPQILRQPADAILTRFHTTQDALLPGWYTMLLAAVLLLPLTVLAAERFVPTALVGVARGVGITASIFQTAGLARWVFLVPSLANLFVNGDMTERTTARIVFQAFHLYAGGGLGEHLGYLFTGLWTLLLAQGLWRLSRPLSLLGGVSALAILAGMLEPLALPGVEIINAVGYIIWSLWLITLGIQTFRRSFSSSQ